MEVPDPRRFQPEVELHEEWEARWEEFVRLAREYGWPEDYLQAYLQDHRVSFQERIAPLDKQRQMWEDLQHEAGWRDWVTLYTEMVFENKRTMLREPENPGSDEYKGLRGRHKPRKAG